MRNDVARLHPDHAGRHPARHGHSKQAERTVRVRSRSIVANSIGALGGLALLLAALPYSYPAASKTRFEPRGVLAEIEGATMELFERVSPSVVGITVITGADDPAKFNVGTGSGFIWD